MTDRVRKVQYFYVMAPDKPGEGARALGVLRDAGVNLIAFSGFPEGRRSQLDFVPEDPAAFRAAAKRAKWKVTGPKFAFVVEGEDRPGAVAEILGKLADAAVNVTATDAVCAGAGRFGILLWVKSPDVSRAAKALGAK